MGDRQEDELHRRNQRIRQQGQQARTAGNTDFQLGLCELAYDLSRYDSKSPRREVGHGL